MRSDGEDVKGARVRAVPDHTEDFPLFFIFIFFLINCEPLDGEERSGALDPN
jgi:hypothetical protein